MRDLPAATAQDVTTVALVGAPNCGKTSLFNALTGGNQRVGNYSGVTVERKIGTATTPTGYKLSVIDLPGTHSLRARSPDEEVTRDIILGTRAGEVQPDLLLVVADATHLRPGLRLAQELKRCGVSVLLVVNMIDIARARGIEIDTDHLSQELGVPVVASTAVRKIGRTDLWEKLDALIAAGLAPRGPVLWSEPAAADLRAALREADRLIAQAVHTPPHPRSWTARIDGVVPHPVAGPLILLGVLLAMFQAVFAGAAPLMDLISGGVAAVSRGVEAALPEGLLRSLLIDGVIAGVGGVVIFLPQIVNLFLFILALEDLGFMARAAFLMDRLMGHAGLHGKAFIPLLSSFACAIPGIMSARVIDDRRDRLTTILIAPLMTCSARIPVYTLLIGAFIPARAVGPLGLQGLVLFGLYAAGIVSALAVALIARLTFRRHEIAAPLILDLPDYKLPQGRGIVLGLWQRAWSFLRRAGTIILAASLVIWALSTFPLPPEGASGPAIQYSFAAWIGQVIAPLFAPIGFTWEICVALIPGLAAREVAVAGLGTVYAISGGEAALGSVLAAQWGLPTDLSLLAWDIFSPQCLSTLILIRREAGGARWMWIAIACMFALAYAASFVTYQLTRLLGA
ncbi:ferrous iron transporter B [Roseibacterium beibuensis]|uniref:Ferrous iron transport protein B n=1 Tax=[Roseibacterium] beibuensis TaxID=1193142 RepID=A0ABP9LF57_9RHOB|nr:ferrous iron transporter B [Roseibacterium beibuensis]MCS6623570.1 ferrous iron transporter B [Roseibacterium beibuensis]